MTFSTASKLRLEATLTRAITKPSSLYAFAINPDNGVFMSNGASLNFLIFMEVHHGNGTECCSSRPLNKGKIVGQKSPFNVKDIWALRVRLQMQNRTRELALFNLGIDSKLRGCDLVSLKVRDIWHGDHVAARAVVLQRKTQRPVQFEITEPTRDALQKWIKQAELRSENFVFPSRLHSSPHLGTRQYARLLEGWVKELGLDAADYGTHSLQRTKATLIYRRTKNLRAVQLLLGHSKLESTVRYLGIEVDDALEFLSKRKSNFLAGLAECRGQLRQRCVSRKCRHVHNSELACGLI